MAHPTVRRTISAPHRSGKLPPAILAGALLLAIGAASPVLAQRCTTQNGQTICCDSSGNCYRK